MNNLKEFDVKCPRCRQLGKWFSTHWGPFCGERCKLIDLGKWFNEEQRISRDLRPGDFDGFDQLPSGPHLDIPGNN